jgi:uncharacterized membrane protein
MSGYRVAERSHSGESEDRISVPTVIAIALLCGVGLVGVAYWLLTQNWLYFAALIPLIGGAFLLFTRLSGPDRA